MKNASRNIFLAVWCILAGFCIWYALLRIHPTPDPAGVPAAGNVRTPEIVGVGVALGLENRTFKIFKVVPNTPAARAGLSAGLIVRKINDTATEGRLLKDCVEMVRGEAGTKVRLELFDPAHNTINTVELTRERIQ